jgi:hypothetical protein
MKSFTSKKRVRKAPGRFPSESRQLTKNQVESTIAHFYNSKPQWSLHLSKYSELFSTPEEAELKARTHAVGLACRNLRNRYGCSLGSLYKIVLNYVRVNEFDIEKSVLNLENKWEFIDSIFVL